MSVTDELTPRERFNRTLSFQCPGKTLATLGGIWPSALRRWTSEGMPPEIDSVPKLIDHLGLQRHTWCSPAAKVFTYPPFQRRIVHEDDTKVTYINPHGVTTTDFKEDAYQSMPHFEDYPVKDRADWDAYKPRLQWTPERLGPRWENQKAQWAERTDPLILAFNCGSSLYGSLRELMGVTGASMAFYDEPAMVAEIMDTVTELFCRCVDAMFTDFCPDAFCLWEDMAYKNASLLSPATVRELMLPRYKVMVAKLREKGVPFILLDSDGYIEELIPIWLEAGIDGFVPFEVQAGMDVADCRRRYPRMRMLGGVDKRALDAVKDAIDREIDRIAPAVEAGGFVPWFDHGLPHDVAWGDFLHYTDRLKQLAWG